MKTMACIQVTDSCNQIQPWSKTYRKTTTTQVTITIARVSQEIAWPVSRLSVSRLPASRCTGCANFDMLTIPT
jgi:hypothetical protein